MALDILDWTDEEIMNAAQSLGARADGARIIGVYYEVSAGKLFSGEYVRFIGIDVETGQRIVANYAGATIEGGASLIPGTNFGGGAFAFTGGARQFSGLSVGWQLSSGNVKGGSISLDGTGNTLTFVGNNTSIGFNVSGGYTYHVTVDGQTIYNFGSQRYTHDFDVTDSDQYDQAMAILMNIEGREGAVEINMVHPDGYIIVQRFYIIEKGPDGVRVARHVWMEDEDGNRVPERISREFLGPTPWDVAEYSNGEIAEIVSFRECFLTATPVTLSDGTTKPIEAVVPGDHVLSYDGNGNLVSGRVVRTFSKDAKHILDFFGLMVTPGHVMFCADGRFAGRHV
ncbi:Hint domain-containing protein, partial [Tropicimonas sp.]|uniref:Hint domain-containing protein n=1 Tax=Tropicimonas sp. TaxID=2067044 RepID=UPI003A8616E2